MTDLIRRTATGIIYGALVLGAVLSSREVFVVGLAAVIGLALFELSRLARAGLPAALELAAIAVGAVSLLYLRDLTAVPFTVLRGSSGPLLMTVLAVWAADVGAYAVGTSIGRNKIAPRISPGKTWEGTIAGLVAGALVVIFWNRPLLGLPVWSVAAALLVGPAAFAGDLLESWVKRRAGVKDSGTLLPGHGGVLDRIDSLLAASPVVALAIGLLGPMG